MTVAGPKIIEIWSRGQRYIPIASVIVVLGLHSALWITFGGDANVINNVDLAHKLVPVVFLEAVCFIGLSILLVPKYGGLGIAAAMLIGFVCTSGWYIPYKVTSVIREGIRKHETRAGAIA